MTNKPDISPYVYFEDMEEGMEYVGVRVADHVPVSSHYVRHGCALHIHNGVSSYDPSDLVFIPCYQPPKPVNSWDSYMDGRGWFYFADSSLTAEEIQTLADDPKAHAAFNDLIESKRNKDG